MCREAIPRATPTRLCETRAETLTRRTRMKNPMRIVAVAAALAMLLAVSAGGASASAKHRAAGKPIIIAMPLALSGVISFYDQPNLAGAQIAVEQINKAGGVLGRPFKIISADTKSDLSL